MSDKSAQSSYRIDQQDAGNPNACADPVQQHLSDYQQPATGFHHARYNEPLADESAVKHNSPWLFGFLGIPNGLSNAIIVLLMPYVLRRQGVSVDRIAEIVALASIPNVWYFLYSPVVDLGLRRRTWILLSASTAGLCSALAILLIPVSLPAVIVTLFTAAALGSERHTRYS